MRSVADVRTRGYWAEFVRPVVFLAVIIWSYQAAAATAIEGVDTYLSAGEPDGISSGACCCGDCPPAGTLISEDTHVEIDIFVGVHGGPAEPLLWFDLDIEPDRGSGTFLERFAATPGATATLQINWNNGTDPTNLHRVIVDWISGQAGDGSDGGNNISRDAFEDAPDALDDPAAPALIPGDNVELDSFASFDNQVTGIVTIDVSEDVSAWAEGEPNFGWGFIPSASQGGEFLSFENPDEAGRPQLILLGPDGSELSEKTSATILKPGDANGDGGFNISDPVALLNFLFAGGALPDCFIEGDSDPADPDPVNLTEAGLAILDFNGDGGSNIADAVGALNFLFGGGAQAHVLGEGCAEVPGTCDSNCQ